jgi:pimeloyl-ACP methyl ester carboxylesterase
MTVLETATGYAPVNGGRIYYEVAGHGPALVLIHGFSLDAQMWDGQFTEFARKHTVIRYDVRGFGRSSLPDGHYSNADDLRSLLDHLGIQRAAVCGLSMGGIIATEFTLRYQGRTLAFIPVDSANDSMVRQGDTEARKKWADFNRTLGAIRPAVQTGGVQAGIKAWLESDLFAPEREDPKVLAVLERIVSGYSGWHWQNPPPYLPFKPDPAARFHEIRVPTLIIVGDRDMPAFQLVAEAMSRDIPGAKLAVIRGAGHMSNMDRPEEFNRLVLGFLSAL